MIYLDYNATTPCHDEVINAMLPYFRVKFGNAASAAHAGGWIADEAVTQARAQVARLIGAEKQEIIFTSGATEGCNLAIKGLFELFSRFSGDTDDSVIKKKHIITCATEHKAVLDTCAHLQRLGADITCMPVDGQGRMDLDALRAAIRKDTLLIACMYANNETGVIHPVSEISAIAKEKKVIFFSDATQAIGKIPVDVRRDGIDIMALSAHKFYGPKGIGALYVRRKHPRIRLIAQMDGGGHEQGFRSGTLNVPGIVGMGKAAALCSGNLEADRIRMLRDELERKLLMIPGAKVNGAGMERLPNVCNIAFSGIKADRLIALLGTKIALSAGSACTAASGAPSHVLAAMGKDKEEIAASIRLSLGWPTTGQETEQAAAEIAQAVALLRKDIL